MKKHTPGPWMAGIPSSIVGWPVIAPGALSRLICSVAYSHPEEPEAKANAELIADAPRLKAENAELLAALKAIHDRLKPFRVTYQHQSEKDALRWAEEAIAKAEE